MKKQLLSLVLLFSTGIICAQDFVSTSIEKKNAVVEEFTGYKCIWCPEGHDMVSDFAADNPGRVAVINIHTGSYATPSAGDPDYRTSFGPQLASQSDLSGYPAGTVNRRVFTGWEQKSGTAMSRGRWDDAGDIVLGEDSPVNAAVKAAFNEDSTSVEIEVEIYYTSDDYKTSTNKLNVYILQNNIEGPQYIASSLNPDQELPNGNYNHQHMLRDMPTGQWGEDITNPEKDMFIEKTYSWDIPADIEGVAVVKENIEVAVSIAEYYQVILTGDMTTVEAYTPPPDTTSVADLNASKNLVGIYPNPSSSEQVFVQLSVKQANIAVFDAIGNRVASQQLIGAGRHQLNVQNLNPGIYFVEVNADGQHEQQKLIIK